MRKLVKSERLHERVWDKIASEKHREFGEECYAVNLDFVEWREGRGVVALVEWKCEDEELTKMEKRILIDLASAKKVPAYVIRHYDDFTDFYIYQIITFLSPLKPIKLGINFEELKRFHKEM